MRDPTLAYKILPAGNGYKVSRVFRVEGGLHYIKGNSGPYFSLTYTAHRRGFPNQCESGGAGHDEILRHFPRFADLAALHLCSIDGAPMHAVENGLYNLAGAMENHLGQRYHAGNSKRHFPADPPSSKPWQNTEYREPTRAECLQSFADYWRIPLSEAQEIARQISASPAGDAEFCSYVGTSQKAELLRLLTPMVDALRPRWKAEAEACIAKHKLVVYGDAWPVAA
jgi:hypothetical protein